MSCFLDTNVAANAESPPSFNSKNLRVDFVGDWTTDQESGGLEFRVSKAKGDTLSLVFTGTDIYVAGRISFSQGMNALFGIDEVGRQGGGVLCATSSKPGSSVVLYAASSLPPGRHTLFITNQKAQLSLSGFQVAAASVSSTSLTSTTSSTLTIAFPTTTSLSSDASIRPRTSSSSTFLTIPPPSPPPSIPSERPPPTPSKTPSDPAPTTLTTSVSGHSPSDKVSTYTTVTILGGTTTTLVIESTVGASQHLTPHGPSRGTIPGAVVGGAVLLSLLLCLCLWWRRHRGRGGHVPLLNGRPDPDPEPEMATRLISNPREPVRRSGALAISPLNPISSDGPRDSDLFHHHHDTSLSDSGDAQVLPSASELPAFASHPPEPSPDFDNSLQRSDNADGALGSSEATTTDLDSKPDSRPENLPVEPSPPSREPDEVIAPPPVAVPRRERNGWRARARARRLMIEEDGGVRLAGGPLGDAALEGDDSGGWEILPPPYHHFR